MPEKTSVAARSPVEPVRRGAVRDSTPPALLSTILGLQQSSGNRAVQRLLGKVRLQPKLRIGRPGDTYEREADHVAERVLRGAGRFPVPISVADANTGAQRMCADCEEELLRESEPAGRDLVQRQCHCGDEEKARGTCRCHGGAELLQPSAAGESRASTHAIEQRVSALRGSGRPLPIAIRRFFEPRFGHDFSAVRVHTGPTARTAAEALNARAFTVGHDVVFGSGEWSPETDRGRRLLAHELTHVIQQTPLVARRKPSIERAEPTGESLPGADEGVAAPDVDAPSPDIASPDETVEPEEAEAAEPLPAATVVVEDDAADVGAGQMRKSDFLVKARTEVCAAAEAGFAGRQSADACPFIGFAFAYYEGQTASRLNRDLPRFVAGGPQPDTAEGYIAAIAERVRTGVEAWARTGKISGVPRALLAAAMQIPEVQAAAGMASAFGVQLKARPGGPRHAGSPFALRAALGRGRPLRGSIRSRMESAFGRSFSGVEVHTDARAASLASRLNARAFTIGNHVAFGAGEYRPGTLVGDALMAHELAHVAQQSAAAEAVQPMTASGPAYGALERDADLSAAGAVARLWGLHLPGLALLRPAPRLTAGLRLQRCDGCNGKEQTPAATGVGATPAAPTPPAKPKCCDFESFTASNDTYIDKAKESRKKIKFTFKMKPGADEKKCVMVNWVQGYGKRIKTGKPFKVTMFGKTVDFNFADMRIDSVDKDPVYWSEAGKRWDYASDGKDTYYATDNPGPALKGEDWQLTFRMCLHCSDDVDKTSDAAGSGVKNPLKCINWDFKAKYDKKAKAWQH